MLCVRVPLSRAKPADASFEKLRAVTDDQPIYPIFVYCASGDRAAALWMIRRVVRENWTLANAEAEAGKAGLTAGTMWNFAHDYIGRQARVASAR